MGQGRQGSRRQGRVTVTPASGQEAGAASPADFPTAAPASRRAAGNCVCGKVRFEIIVPAIWAWHDHTPATRRAHGAASATYVGTWRKRFFWLAGEKSLRQYRDLEHDTIRSFCRHCGTPVLYERGKSPHVINIPRSLFNSRCGRDTIYHFGFDEQPDWGYDGGPLVPLPGYPGVLWQRNRRARRRTASAD